MIYSVHYGSFYSPLMFHHMPRPECGERGRLGNGDGGGLAVQQHGLLLVRCEDTLARLAIMFESWQIDFYKYVKFPNILVILVGICVFSIQTWEISSGNRNILQEFLINQIVYML